MAAAVQLCSWPHEPVQVLLAHLGMAEVLATREQMHMASGYSVAKSGYSPPLLNNSTLSPCHSPLVTRILSVLAESNSSFLSHRGRHFHRDP